MQQETTCERLLESAGHESLSNGYQEASPKTICRNAGITTGALYFFFKDKSALFHALVKDVAEAVMQMLYQHTNFGKEVYNDTDQLMDMEHDIRFTQKLISFHYAHKTALELLSNYSWGSTYQNFTEQIIAYLVKRNARVISAMVKDGDTVFNARTLYWSFQIQVETLLHILPYHYFQEQALHQIRIVVTFLQDGFEDLHQQVVKNQIRGVPLFSFIT